MLDKRGYPILQGYRVHTKEGDGTVVDIVTGTRPVLVEMDSSHEVFDYQASQVEVFRKSYVG